LQHGIDRFEGTKIGEYRMKDYFNFYATREMYVSQNRCCVVELAVVYWELIHFWFVVLQQIAGGQYAMLRI